MKKFGNVEILTLLRSCFGRMRENNKTGMQIMPPTDWIKLRANDSLN